MDSDEETLSTYSSFSVTSRTATTISTRDSASNAVPAVQDHNDDEVFEDASSDISILTKRESSIHLDRTKLRQGILHDLNTHTLVPLFLRKCELQKARKGSAPPNIIPIEKVETIEAYKKMSGHSTLLSSLNSPTYCVRYLASNPPQKCKNVLVYAAPIKFVRFVARPEPQKTNQSVFEDPSETVRLMMSPDESITAKKMLPKWQTVTFTLAFGKHVGVKYRIMETRKQSVIHVKPKVERVHRVSTKTLYRNEPIQNVEYWKCSPVHELNLTTVEKNDPQLVKRVFLETTGETMWNHSTEVISAFEKRESDNDPRVKKIKVSKELNLTWQRTDEQQ